MMGSSERIRVPLEMFLIATRPFPLPGTSSKAYIGLPVMLCIFPLSLPVISTPNDNMVLNGNILKLKRNYVQ